MNVTKWFAVVFLLVFGMAGIAVAEEKNGGKWLLYCENNAGKYYYDPDAIAFGSEYMHFKVKYKIVPNEQEKEQLLTKIIKKTEHYVIVLADIDLKKELIKLESSAVYLGKELEKSSDEKGFVRPLTWEEHKKLADIVVKWVQKWSNTNPVKAEKYFANGAKNDAACKKAESDLRNSVTRISVVDEFGIPKNWFQLMFAFRDLYFGDDSFHDLNGTLIYAYYGGDDYRLSLLHPYCEDVYYHSSGQFNSMPKAQFKLQADREEKKPVFSANFDNNVLTDHRWTSFIIDQKKGKFQFTKSNKLIYNSKEMANVLLSKTVTRIAISPTSQDASYAIVYSYDDNSQLKDSYLLDLNKYDAKKLDLGTVPNPREFVYWPAERTHAILGALVAAQIEGDAETYKFYKLDLPTLAVSESTVDSFGE